METAKVFKIALVCPSDVVGDRSVAAGAIEGLQRAAERRGVRLSVRTWEDVPPNFYPEKVQTRIDEDLDIPTCDIVIGIFWKRYGVIDEPPYSRTAREILRAMEAKRVRGAPQVMVYFANREYMPQSEDESSQQTQVLRFRAELQSKEVRTKEFTSSDFNLIVALDVLEYLDEFAFGPGPSAGLTCRLSLTPTFVRSEGYTELICEPAIVISGIIPSISLVRVVRADLTVWLNSSVTNRIEGSVTNAVVVSNVRGPLGRGQLIRNNGILFGIPLGPTGSRIDEVLSIRGVRVDAEFLGVASFESKVTAALELAIVNVDQSRLTLLKETFIAATVKRSVTFSVSPMGREVMKFGAASRPEGAREHSFVVTFYIPFEGAFKTREQEAANSAGSADHGTALAVAVANVPPDTAVFVTCSSIREGEFSETDALFDNAVMVQTNAAGKPVAPIDCSSSGLAWKGQTKMWEVSQGLAVWELVKPIPPDAPRMITFGITFLRRGDTSTPIRTTIAAGFAPFYGASSGAAARQPSQTLPIPRFIPGHTIIEIELPGSP